MKTDKLISVNVFCLHNNVEVSFIKSLQNSGLISVKSINDEGFIEANQLVEIEKYIHFYYELDINIEGIETISHLLQRISSVQEKLGILQNTLRLYENKNKD